ncbi:hypothetical protein SAMN02787144_102955 [Streptomyces atratus]|uniref:Uncharacterized protein n=1 Tax=Streptomyces atratus TaxID=1893 RepID=A0A1K2F2X4_STRAR|nr:hypothetical protein SAMN02787144_102955 [Streptomyces atratus]
MSADSAGVLRDGAQSALWPVAELVDGLGGFFVRREEDDQLLGIRGEFERLTDRLEPAAGRVVEPEDAALRNQVTVHAPLSPYKTDRQLGGG